nr:hypothetical protein [Tanacetum cinerariifolium]
MVEDLKYFKSLEHEVASLQSQLVIQQTQFSNKIDRLSREYYYADHINAILGVYTELDEVTNLQCDYLELLKKCKGLETELSKSKMMSKSFKALQKHAINLENDLQQYQEKIKNNKSFIQNMSKEFRKEREQYFKIQDLKAQLQDKGIVISELKKLIEKLKGKFVDTKVTNLQCDYLELLQECECLETELSKSKMMSKSFESVQKHAINLELELQQCKEKDLKAQLQDKGIVISELKKLIEKLKRKSVDTNRIGAGLEQFHRCLNEEMVADLRYFNSLELEVDSLISQLETQKTQFLNDIDRLSREYYYADHMNTILGVYTELDEVTNLQCDYLELLEKCEGLETELSKSKMMSKSFESVQKHAINLELELQQCKEKIKNDKSFKVSQTKYFCKEREQYFQIQDLKAQLQDKGIVISELKKLIEKLKGKSVDTKFENSSVIRQPNALKSQRPSVLGKPTTFSNSFLSKSKTQQTYKRFANLEERCIDLELALQHEKEKNICEDSWVKQSLISGDTEKALKDKNDSLIAKLNCKTIESHDLGDRLQDRIIANAEIRDSWNKIKGKNMDTNFGKPSIKKQPVVRQPTAFKFE